MSYYFFSNWKKKEKQNKKVITVGKILFLRWENFHKKTLYLLLTLVEWKNYHFLAVKENHSFLRLSVWILEHCFASFFLRVTMSPDFVINAQYKTTSFNDKTFEKHTWFITLIKKISPSVVFCAFYLLCRREAIN